MELRVLGPVELWLNGTAMAARTRPQQWVVLTALAVDAGQVLAMDSLVDRVWGAQPPPGARRTLHSHISRIRRLLDEAGVAEPHKTLRHERGGYRLQIGKDQVDMHRFRHLLDEASQYSPADAQGVALLEDALGLWRGEPLGGLKGDWAERTRERCHHQRIAAVLAWAEGQHRLGNVHLSVDALADLLSEYPLVESITAALMRAFHTGGRTADALGHYQMTRLRLREDVGIDPCADLQRLHQSILRGAELSR